MFRLILILGSFFYNLQFSYAAENQFFEVIESIPQSRSNLNTQILTQVSNPSILRNARPPFIVKLTSANNTISYFKITSETKDLFFQLVGDYYAQNPSRAAGQFGGAAHVLNNHPSFVKSKIDAKSVSAFVNTSEYRRMLNNARRLSDNQLIKTLRARSLGGRAGIVAGVGAATASVISNFVELPHSPATSTEEDTIVDIQVAP